MKNKDEQFFNELKEIAAMVPGAMKRLRKVTGKFGYAEIDPINEKRWSEQCWEDFGVLVALAGMIQHGKTKDELGEELISQWKPQDDSWIGKVSYGQFKCETVPKRFDKVFPRITRKWKAANFAPIGKPCDPK